MGFKNSKNNLKELGKDLKGLAVSTVGLVVGLVKIPVALCKDIRDEYLRSKETKEKSNVETKAA